MPIKYLSKYYYDLCNFKSLLFLSCLLKMYDEQSTKLTF